MKKNNERGLSLVEILAATAILTIGFLGFSNVQLRSLALSMNSHSFNKAASIASDVSDRIRVNVSQQDTVALKAAAIDAYLDYNWGQVEDCSVTPPAVTACGPSGVFANGSCTAGMMSEYDAYESKCAMNSMFPRASMVFSACPGSANVYCTYIAWDGAVPNDATCNDPSGKCIRMELVP